MPGILQKKLAADQGLVEVPMLTPHLGFRLIEDGQALIISENLNSLINGRVYTAVLPLLDGKHSQQDIVAKLDGAHSALEVRTALTALAARGYLVSGEFAMERSSAAFWTALGASPRWAEERLRASKVAITGDKGRLADRLKTFGIAATAENPTLSVVFCNDYLSEQHAAINRRSIESGQPWTLLMPDGARPLFGPVFRPAEQGPCWSCLAYRLRGHQEVHNFLRNVHGEDAAFHPPAAEPVSLEAVCGLAAIEIAKWLVLAEGAPLHEQVFSLDLPRLETARHYVTRRPQCTECGDESLYRADRPPIPIRLQPSPKTLRNSGGLRSATPEETMAKYRHLVSPISGVVTWHSSAVDEKDPWLHVHWAGSNFALRTNRLGSLRKSLRSKSAGKGSTPPQSAASALCEAVERYCCGLHGDEIRRRASYADFAKSGDSEAIHPNEVQLFSERQLDKAEEINARGHPLNHVPPRFEPEVEIDWSPVWSFTEGRHRYLPTSMLYAVMQEHAGPSGLKADTNGCAAGNTLEEAILQGFYELVERDAFAVWWYNRIRLPGVDLTTFDDEYLLAAPDYYRGHGREMWVLDATGDLGIPVFVAVSNRPGEKEESIIYGAGAHADPHIAALRAVCEMNQFLQWEGVSGQAAQSIDDPMTLEWWKNATLKDHTYFAPIAGTQRGAADYPVSEPADLAEEVERCRALVEAKGMEFLALDLTRPDIGMPVARVIVPGMRHFWERFAPGRLYDVPVELGWRETSITEAELNPAPVTI